MIKVAIKTDQRALRDKLRRMANASPAARREATVIIAREVMSEVMRTKHHDTNRYVNGWAMAANSAGLGIFPVRPLNKAAGYYIIQRRLVRQYNKWLLIVNRYRATDPERRDKWVRKAERNLERAAVALERFERTQGGAVIAFDLRTAAHKGKLVSIREPQIYGGQGRILDTASRTLVVLHNREAHASIVESRFRVVQSAMAKFRAIGYRSHSKKWVRDIVAAAGSARAA